MSRYKKNAVFLAGGLAVIFQCYLLSQIFFLEKMERDTKNLESQLQKDQIKVESDFLQTKNKIQRQQKKVGDLYWKINKMYILENELIELGHSPRRRTKNTPKKKALPQSSPLSGMASQEPILLRDSTRMASCRVLRKIKSKYSWVFGRDTIQSVLRRLGSQKIAKKYDIVGPSTLVDLFGNTYLFSESGILVGLKNKYQPENLPYLTYKEGQKRAQSLVPGFDYIESVTWFNPG